MELKFKSGKKWKLILMLAWLFSLTGCISSFDPAAVSYSDTISVRNAYSEVLSRIDIYHFSSHDKIPTNTLTKPVEQLRDELEASSLAHSYTQSPVALDRVSEKMIFHHGGSDKKLYYILIEAEGKSLLIKTFYIKPDGTLSAGPVVSNLYDYTATLEVKTNGAIEFISGSYDYR